MLISQENLDSVDWLPADKGLIEKLPSLLYPANVIKSRK